MAEGPDLANQLSQGKSSCPEEQEQKPVKLCKNVAELGENKGYLSFPQQPGGPSGIAVSPKFGHIFITDQNNHQIHVFDEQRKHIRSFGEEGSDDGQLKFPVGIAVGTKGLVYVSNNYNHRIEVFREDGTFVKNFGEIKHPCNMKIDNEKLFVADNRNHGIAIFTLEGQLIRTIGCYGFGPGQFIHPSSVAISPNGDMYVVDQDNHRIQVLNSGGVYQREFGFEELKYPLDILITADGHVLVADYGNKRVAIFNTTGQLIHSFGVGSKLHGLAIDHNGDLLVGLYETKQVAIF